MIEMALDTQIETQYIFKDAVKYIPSNVIPALCGLLSVSIFTRMVSPDDFAQYILILTTVTFLANIGFSWLNYSGYRFFDETKNNPGPLLSTSFFSLIFLLILFSSGAYVMALYLEQYTPGTNFRFAVSIGIPLLMSKVVFDQLLIFLRADRKVTKHSVYKTIDAFAKLGLGIFFIKFFNIGYAGIIYGMIFSFSILLVFELLNSRMYQVIRFSLFSSTFLMKLIKYGFPLLGAGLTTSILSISEFFFDE